MGKPFLLPEDWAMYLDLVQMGLGECISYLTALEVLQVWIDRKNRLGFDYETLGIDNKKKMKHDFPYLLKTY